MLCKVEIAQRQMRQTKGHEFDQRVEELLFALGETDRI